MSVNCDSSFDSFDSIHEACFNLDIYNISDRMPLKKGQNLSCEDLKPTPNGSEANMSSSEKELDLRIDHLQKELALAEQERDILRAAKMQQKILMKLLKENPSRQV